jgi:hypothetical protein
MLLFRGPPILAKSKTTIERHSGADISDAGAGIGFPVDHAAKRYQTAVSVVR